MPVYQRYPEDPTGVNPDNFISGEVHTLSDRPIRVIVPRYAPFFVKSVIIYDGLTMQPLIKGSDYRIPTISQELSLKYGEAIADAILIENPSVSSDVRISYQAVGGDYQNNIDNIVNIYEALMNDVRLVDWETGVYGKPAQYPPTLHPHWLSDISGFEPLVFEMERIAQAIMLGNTPAFDMILAAIRAMAVSEAEIDLGAPVAKFMTQERLLYALDKYNYNSMTITPVSAKLLNGRSQWFEVKCTNVPDQVTYYWTIAHEGTDQADFEANSGLVTLVNGVGRFMVQSVKDRHAEDEEYFRVQVRRSGILGLVMATSRVMTLLAHRAIGDSGILEALRISCMNSPRLGMTAKTHGIQRRSWTARFN